MICIKGQPSAPKHKATTPSEAISDGVAFLCHKTKVRNIRDYFLRPARLASAYAVPATATVIAAAESLFTSGMAASTLDGA